MGHLINPAGFRVGYFSNWVDLWSTSNNLVYAEVLHNTVLLRRAMMPLFENFVTDRYSILYSHFTLEVFDISKMRLKMYFYDGIVEQKLEHLFQQLNKFRVKKAKTHRRLLRRFWKVKLIRGIRSRFLRVWRYYDYLAARQIIFFFIYFLYMGISSLSPDSFINVLRYYFRVLSVEWCALLRKNYSMSVSAFVKYYVKLLIVKGFDTESSTSSRLHFFGGTSDFVIFFKALDETLFFWQKYQNFWDFAVTKGALPFKKAYQKFLNPVKVVNQFSTYFFSSLFRTYLLSFRQAKFFRFMNFILTRAFSTLGVLDTKVEFFGLDNDSVSAIFLARYIARKIEMRFQIKELFTPIGREMRYLRRNTVAIAGYKLQFVGRLTRRGRVRTTWRVGGSIPTSTMSAQVEHSFYLGILRNGICCVRVWLYRHKSFGNYTRSFVYRVKS